MRIRITLTLGIFLMAGVALMAVSPGASAAWPGANGRLVVEAVDGIYVWEIGSSQAVKLSEGELPKWSPGGSQIAFGSGEFLQHADGRPYGRDIWVMDDDGSDRRNLTDGIGWSSHPTWSQNGSMIAFQSIRDPYTDIWVDGDYNIWVMNADGSNQRQLTNDPGWEHRPMWSPDGSKIAYVAGDTVHRIWVMDAHGGNQKQLTDEPGHAAHDVSWSPDGSSIAYTRYEDVVEGEPGDVFVMDADGSNKRNLTNHPAGDGSPVWSPDGTTIIFWSDREEDGGLWSMNADGSDPVRLALPDEIEHAPHFFDWERIRTSRFDDVLETHTFFADVEWLASTGITKGCDPPLNTLFCPDTNVTRGQMAAFLVRALSLTDDGGGTSFVDDDGNIFETDIAKLAAAGVTKGCNPPANDMFCPHSNVTRGQMAAFLVRALGYPDDGGGNQFTDDDGNIFETSIDKLATAGVTRGCNPPVNDQFCPHSNVTRGQMAAFLHRALGT